MDLCEKEPALAYRVNALGARNLSIVARKIGAKIVQISTDDVFDGNKNTPYSEFDDTNPKTVYGRSKRAGENYVREFTHKHFVIRSSWIFGHGDNFVTCVLRKAGNGELIEAAIDETGCPTSAKDLARIILYLITTNEYGTYHATCKGLCSRYDFAREILSLAGLHAEVKEISIADSKEHLVRPAYAVLDNFILRIIDVYEMPKWKQSLEEYIAEWKEETHE